MNATKIRMLQIAACVLSASCPPAWADWAQTTDPLVISAMPTNLQSQVQNPPTFTWARYATTIPSYTLEIRNGSTVVQTYVTVRNWYLPSTTLPAGTYSWRVRPTNSTDWSTPRQFIIGPGSAPFIVPENAALEAAIVNRPRPRGLPSNLPPSNAWSAALKAERANALLGLSNEVLMQVSGVPTARDASWPLVATTPVTAAYDAQLKAIQQQINLSTRQLEAAALLYHLTADPRFLAEALRRGDELAALDPNGPTSYINQDQGDRAIALSLAKGVDSLATALDATRRAKWLSIINVRTDAMYRDLSGSGGRMDESPYDSHGGNTLGFLALIATLSLGDIPAATTWFEFALRDYASSLMVWSGPEGGYSNGSAYGEYAVDYSLQIWQPLLAATGINMFNKPWALGFLQFFMEFVPPGSKTHLFGDAQEAAPQFKFMKSYASRFATPAAAWYARSLTGNEDNLTLLQAPTPLPVNSVTTAAPPANSAYFPSIGWSAMHSNIADLNRTSVYFKSSPFGSFTHGHGDQNAFVLESAGVPLLTATGWYDWFGSPLSASWYRQSKASNTITFQDASHPSGTGQYIAGYRETLQYHGVVTQFSGSTALDFVQGDATAAYAGALTSAVRQLWYLRSIDEVVVRDTLASATAKTFEWNFHALAPIVTSSTGVVSVTNQGRTVCVRPITSTGIHLEKRVGPPPNAGVTEDHAAFVNNAPVTSTEFLVLLDVGCKNPAVSLQTTSGGRTLKVGTQSITLPK